MGIRSVPCPQCHGGTVQQRDGLGDPITCSRCGGSGWIDEYYDDTPKPEPRRETRQQKNSGRDEDEGEEVYKQRFSVFVYIVCAIALFAYRPSDAEDNYLWFVFLGPLVPAFFAYQYFRIIRGIIVGAVVIAVIVFVVYVVNQSQ